MSIADIVSAIRSGRVRVTDHADEEAHADKLTLEEIYHSVLHGEIIEEYPDGRAVSKLLDIWQDSERHCCSQRLGV